MLLRKGYGPLSSGTIVDVAQQRGDTTVVFHNGTYHEVPTDYLTERRPRTTTHRGRNYKERRQLDPIVQAKREEYEKTTQP